MQPEISIAVISRTVTRMSEFLESVEHSTTIENNKIEVLCAWNGGDDYSEILIPSGINFKLKIIKPYNFAKNNNRLAEKATSKIIAFINDDVILDPNSLDHAMEALNNECVGIVGANLRYQDGRLQHAGVFFDPETGKPFHRLKGKVAYDDEAVSCSRFVPALTGAFLLMRLDEFISVKFQEDFEVAGEDIVLCTSYLDKFQRKLLYAANVTALHIENATRKTTGHRDTPQSDMDRILDARSKHVSHKKLKVRIVTEKPGWIMYRKAEEIQKNSDYLDVVINEDAQDADIHYYINYGMFNKRPSKGIVVANFTHYDEDGLGDKFSAVANIVDHCTAVSSLTKTDLIDFSIPEEKITQIIVGADRSFKPKLLVGMVGRVYKGGRKGEHLVNALCEDPEVSSLVDFVAPNETWEVPVLKTETLHTFYRAIDYLLIPSLIEGGPVPFMEALATGTLSIAPKLGVVPEFTHVEYELGDYNSLKAVLITLAKDHIHQREFLGSQMAKFDWENWGFEHELLFHNLMIKQPRA